MTAWHKPLLNFIGDDMRTQKPHESTKKLSDNSISQEKTNKLLTEKEAAEFLGLTQSALQGWRSTGRYSLPFIKLGFLVRYRESDLRHWLDTRTRSGSTA